MSIKAIIIEDEPPAATKLERTLSKLNEQVEVLAKLGSVIESINWLRQNRVDLIFCDIHLGDALSFEIFKQIEVKTPVIFTTAYDQYAIQAFEVNSIDYLLKPIRQEDLEKAINKFKERTLNTGSIPIDQLLKSLHPLQTEYQKRFLVYTGEQIKTIPVEEIAYFFAEGKYVYLTSHDDRAYLVDYTLDKLEALIDPDQFFRINRQFIISLECINKMFAYPKGRVKLILNPKAKREVIVSIDRSPEFKKWLNR